MKVTFAFPVPSLCGGCRVVAIYAQALANNGHEVTIVCPSHKNGGVAATLKRLMKGDIFLRDHLAHSHFSNLAGVNIIQLPPAKMSSPSFYPRADVLVATWWKTVEWIAGFPEEKGKKCYFVQHHEVHDEQPRERVELTYKTPYPKIVIAEWLSKVMAEQYDDHRTHLVPNAVDHTLFFREEDTTAAEFTVCSMYSETRFKGVDITLSAFSRVRERIPQAHMIMFGAEPLRDGRTLPEGVEFVLAPSRAKLRQIYASSRAYVFSSRSEGFGLPILEALACGCPVVATDAGCAPEYIRNGVNGYINEVDDVDGQANSIESILRLESAAWVTMSKAAIDAVANSSWSNSSNTFEKVLACLTDAEMPLCKDAV
ncbi:glycosyltransferase family 4 protein [Microbulbifer harenosus]|uniref:Glycosyltransferase family 4 protein n=1 Tax=Microbulbifer harenosus TaxID=2576840 RepID=A0ABY2UEF2_9GAMM|nr:glycosyltransferase family 4 protein [Microbulbifer harenosus]TLM75621.1 glycosyltransferase family 4 protein [Microbulbifer harenosus]